jgi:hypothetical protein
MEVRFFFIFVICAERSRHLGRVQTERDGKGHRLLFLHALRFFERIGRRANHINVRFAKRLGVLNEIGQLPTAYRSPSSPIDHVHHGAGRRHVEHLTVNRLEPKRRENVPYIEHVPRLCMCHARSIPHFQRLKE